MINFIPGIKQIIREEGFLNPDIAWFTDPRHLSILNVITPKKIIYRCVDNLEHFSDVPPNLLIPEKKLIQKKFDNC